MKKTIIGVDEAQMYLHSFSSLLSLLSFADYSFLGDRDMELVFRACSDYAKRLADDLSEIEEREEVKNYDAARESRTDSP